MKKLLCKILGHNTKPSRSTIETGNYKIVFFKGFDYICRRCGEDTQRVFFSKNGSITLGYEPIVDNGLFKSERPDINLKKELKKISL